jgi:hypothetical protein
MPRKTVVWLLLAACAPFTVVVTLAFLACAPTTRQVTIPPPVYSYRSPALDFTKVKGLCIMPVASLRDPPNRWEEEIAPILATSLPAAIQAQFSGWKVYGPDEFLRFVNERNLVRGLQYFQADMMGSLPPALPGSMEELSTLSPQGMQATPHVTEVNFSKETLEFFDQLKFCEALLFVRYQVYLFVPLGKSEIYRAVQLAGTLFHPASGPRARWWVGLFEEKGFYSDPKDIYKIGRLFGEKQVPLEKLVEPVIQSFAQNIGKGGLRNL